MIINYLKTFLLIALISVFAYSCGGDSEKEEDDDSDSSAAADEIKNAPADETAICIWSSLVVRETPSLKGKYKSTMNLGEKAIFLKETAVDSSQKKSPKEFIKIKLTDGSQGWVQSTFMAVGAKTYVLKDKTKLYKRPDILSAGKDEFEKMQFVVVTEDQGEWVKVKGKKTVDTWFKEGWIKTDRLVESEVDVTVAILAERAMLKETDEKKTEALKEIVENPDLNSSMFYSDVKAIYDSYVNPEIPAEGDQGESNQSEGDVEEYYEGD
jgi:hypothetical protein